MRDPKSAAKKPTKKSDWLGQVITPTGIADQMVKTLLRNRASKSITILDACVGPFTFPRALVSQQLLLPDDKVMVVDIDPDMVSQKEKWAELNEFNIQCMVDDYLTLEIGEKSDYAIINPPYIRQEWIDKKEQYRDIFQKKYGVNIPGTSNLYVYFVVKLIQDLKPGGQFSIIIYDSWQSTIYGRWLMEFLRDNCEDLEFEIVSGQPFRNRLIDATILYGTKGYFQKSWDTNNVLSNKSSPFSEVSGFIPLEKLFKTQRGLRLKQVNFFLCDIRRYGRLGATPFLKKVVKLNGLFEVPENHSEAALLIYPQETNDEILTILQNRLREAQREPDKNIPVLTWFKDQPSDWYLHRKAPYAPLVFNYYLRNRPRHIYNPDRAYSDNFYGLTPLNGEPLAWLAILNSTSVCAEIMAHSRNQGNGLAKIQLYEYRKIFIPSINDCETSTQKQFKLLGKELIESPHTSPYTIEKIDKLVAKTFSNSFLDAANIRKVFAQMDNKARKPREQ